MQVERLLSSQDPHFEALAAIYEDAFPASERKPMNRLRQMIERPEYCFLGAWQGNTLAGFSISVALQGTNAGLLEYMAIHPRYRGQGLGESLFGATVSYPGIAGLHMLIEVEFAQTTHGTLDDPARRKAFYRRNGCLEIAGLIYRMPRVNETEPPAMQLLLYRSNPPVFIHRADLHDWLEACYHQVYGVAPGDRRIDEMLEGLDASVLLL